MNIATDFIWEGLKLNSPDIFYKIVIKSVLIYGLYRWFVMVIFWVVVLDA